MLAFVTKQLGSLLAVAIGVSLASALLAVFLLGMVSQSRGGLLLPFNFAIYFAVWCIFIVVSNASSAVLSRHGARAVYHVRMSLIRRILATPYDKLDQAGTSRLYNVLTTDVSNIANTLSELPTFMFNAVLLVCCLSYLAILSWRMFAVLAVGVAFTFVVSKYLIGNLSRHARRMRERQDEMFETYKGMLEGAAQLEVDAARRSLYYERELDASAAQLRQHEQSFRFFWDLNRTTTAALVLLLLGSLIEASRWLHAAAVVTSFMLLITYCTGPFATVLNLLQLFAQSKVSLRKIESLQIGSDQPLPQLQTGRLPWQRIRLSGVEFAYPGAGADERFVLGPLDLEVARGEVVFITGGNGSGKSTLLKLLLGLHEPAGGHVFLDEMRVEDVASRHLYQSLFSIVLSEFHLFRQVLGPDGTVAEDVELARLLEMFNMGSMVESSDGYLSTVQLSQGQRKRLALLSALARDKDIYVLDEWAADQDPHYRKVFYHQIIPWMRGRGKTVIAVTHDDRYFDVADRCVEFEMGRIRNDTRFTRVERVRDGVAVSTLAVGLSRVGSE